MVNWKEIAKIDSHIHLMPEEVRQANIETGGKFVVYGGLEDYKRLMEKYNIEAAFIMPFNDPYMLSMDFTVESVHKNLAQIIEGQEQKLYAFADVDLRLEIKETLRELDRVLAHENFLGIKIHPNNAAYPIDGLYYKEILSYAEKNNRLVEIHSYPKDHLVDDLCSPARIKKALEPYPRLRVSIAHLGGFHYQEFFGLPYYFNISAILNAYVDRLGLEKTNEILRKLGVDRLVFASDYPDNRSLKADEIYDKYFQSLNQMDFTQEEAEKICRTNALKMIGKA
ncbi:MAG: amidohydrolase family protein [Bacillota bacterium]|nr:amidohydrolase family protein [Bacillota bacterium]